MAINLSKFLDKYFRKEWLQEALQDIGEPYSTDKNDLIRRIIEDWSTYRRNWYDLLKYADEDALEDICIDYDLDSRGDEDLLIRRIKRANILGNELLESKQIQSKNQTSKNSDSVTPNINFNINSIHFSERSKIGIISIIVAIIIGVPSLYFTIYQPSSDSSNIDDNVEKPSNVGVSVNQTGGITAGQVNIFSDENKRYLNQDFIKNLNLCLSDYKTKTMKVYYTNMESDTVQFTEQIKSYLDSEGYETFGVSQVMVFNRPIYDTEIMLSDDGNVAIWVGLQRNDQLICKL